MSSYMWSIEDVAARDIAYWLAPGGTDNGVWADTWTQIADLECDAVTEVLDLLAKVDVGGYAAIPGGQRARAKGPVRHRLWVDSMQYGLAEDVLIRFMQNRCGAVVNGSARGRGRVPDR
jgi:hypothetical protein